MPPSGIGDLFLERTRHAALRPSDQQHGVAPPPIVAPFEKGGVVVRLPAPEPVRHPALDPVRLSAAEGGKGAPASAQAGPLKTPLATALKTLVDQRVSHREFAPSPLSLAELSYLLWCTQGVKQVVDNWVTMRTVPSAGARHALETWLLVHRVEALEPGLYRYLPLEHALRAFRLEPDIGVRVTRACLGQSFVWDGAATFIWSAVIERMCWRYGERGYRYIFLDAGHVGQNLYLAAESIGCGACAVAAFDDDEMNRLLELDGHKEFVVYLGAVGRKKA